MCILLQYLVEENIQFINAANENEKYEKIDASEKNEINTSI